MSNFIEGLLYVSSNLGRYQVGPSGSAPDITSGAALSICLGGRWIDGFVEHGDLYATERVATQGLIGVVNGYYFEDDQGQRCGLCQGMRVRLYR